jgi:hypothetical protein
MRIPPSTFPTPHPVYYAIPSPVSITILKAGGNVRVEEGAFLENFAEEGKGFKDVGFVYAGDVTFNPSRFAPPGEVESEVEESFTRVAGDNVGLPCFAVFDHLALAR